MTSEYLGDPQLQVISGLERGQGAEALALNRAIVSRLTRAPHVERFGPEPANLIGSVVVCLYGRPEYLFLQCALFAGLPGMERYEFIYGSNSPELAERLLSEARLAALLYGVSLTLLILPGNAGFAGANNAAVTVARTRRVLVTNPDVFPKERAWALNHSAILLSRPAAETRLFGAPLYYDDGALMHAGMYFEMARRIAFEGRRMVPYQLLRVEHYGKGGLPDDPRLLRPRPVPAVTGAFMSLDRTWFERLEGFSIDFVHGHYEDADLCLRSLEAGSPVWLQDARLWHLEGKGSPRSAEHEAASVLNRWLFTSRWGALATEDLLGPSPAAPSLLAQRGVE